MGDDVADDPVAGDSGTAPKLQRQPAKKRDEAAGNRPKQRTRIDRDW